MKRINLTTGAPFTSGFVREDGFVFKGYTNKVKKDGFFIEHWCSPETWARKLTRRKEYEIETKTYRLQRQKAYTLKHKDKISAYQKAYVSSDKKKAYYKDRRVKKQIQIKEYFKNYRQNNKAKTLANNRKRKLAQEQRMPKWLLNTDLMAIQMFYEKAQKLSAETGVKHHVDHIVPLRGKTVSGLHVPWNLQILTAKENMIKSNRIDT